MDNTNLESIFVIEVCENCRTHNWNTRHDENKYKGYATESNSSTNLIITFLSGRKDR